MRGGAGTSLVLEATSRRCPPRHLLSCELGVSNTCYGTKQVCSTRSVVPYVVCPTHALLPHRVCPTHSMSPKRVCPTHTVVPNMVCPTHPLVPRRVCPTHSPVPERVRPTHSVVPNRVCPTHPLVPNRVCPTRAMVPYIKLLEQIHSRPRGNPGANLNSISHRCYLREVAFEWELTRETIYLPMGCIQGGNFVQGIGR